MPNQPIDLYAWEERAAILEYDAGMTREAAEAKTTEMYGPRPIESSEDTDL